jgi:hypothetical protein
MKFSFESQPNTNKGNESKDGKLPDFIELPKGEVKNPSESRQRIKDLIKIGVLSVVSTLSNPTEAQNNKANNSVDVSNKHEYVLSEVKDFTTFTKLMDKDNEFKQWRQSQLDMYKAKIDEIKANIKKIESYQQNFNPKIGDSADLKFLSESLVTFQEGLKAFINAYSTIEDMGTKDKIKFYKHEQERLEYIFSQYEKQRQWLLSIMKSPEYQARLASEYGGNVPSNISERIGNVEKDSNFFVKDANNALGRASAFYSVESDKVHFSAPSDFKDISTVGVHEFTHESTDGDSLLSDKADSLYRTAFDSSMLNKKDEQDIEAQYKKEYNTSYYGRPPEMDARKKELQYELEKLGVKKYGDTFTKEHYQMLQKLHKEGKLGEGADQFYRMIKPEYFLIIMNTVATVSPTTIPAEEFRRIMRRLQKETDKSDVIDRTG